MKSKKNTQGHQDKADWMKNRFKEGLRYKVLYVRDRKGFASRGFIEYIPSEYVWRGLNAEARASPQANQIRSVWPELFRNS